MMNMAVGKNRRFIPNGFLIGTGLVFLLVLTGCENVAGGGGGGEEPPADPPITTAPVAPSGLNASDGTYISYIRISWNASAGADGYRIYWADNSAGPYTWFTDTAATTFDDYAGGDGSTYYFKVKAFNAYGESDFSNYESGWAIDYTNGSWTPPEGYNSLSDGIHLHKQFLPQSPGYTSYRARMRRGHTYTISIYGYDYFDDPQLSIYSTYGDVLAGTQHSNNNANSIVYECLDEGYYFFRVRNWLNESLYFSIGYSD